MSRNVKIVIVAIAAIAVGIALFSSLAQGQQTSKLDSDLKRTADRMITALASPDSKYATQPSFLNAFNLYQHNEQVALLHNMSRLSSSGQFEQIQLYESQTMPQVWRVIRSSQYPSVTVDAKQIQQAMGGKPFFTTVQQSNLQYRVYVTRVPVPPSLRQGNTEEALEVIKAIS